METSSAPSPDNPTDEAPLAETAPSADVQRSERPRTPEMDLRLMLIRGMDKTDALAALATSYGLGVGTTKRPIDWTLKQINALMFLRVLVTSGRVSEGSEPLSTSASATLEIDTTPT